VKAKYIIRLDDACPTMEILKWNKIESLFDKYKIKPIVAVIPDNKDIELKIDKYDLYFWDKIKRWEEKGWTIGLHGYQHLCQINKYGIISINKKSEFAGLSLEEQKIKLKKAIKIFKEKKIIPKVWIAPRHNFDKTTLIALKDECNINLISDGIALKPYYDMNFYWVPQQFWHFRKMPFGIYTCCIHPNTMSDIEFNKIKKFIDNNYKSFISFNDINFNMYKKNKGLIDRIFTKIFYYTIKKKTI
jgi:predicted deacetylase